MELNRKQILRILLVITISIVIFALVQNLPTVLGLLGGVMNVLTPLSWACASPSS